MTSPSEPRNPLYILLLIAGVVFAVTALAVAVVPVLEEKVLEAGQAPPPSPFRDALRTDGWILAAGRGGRRRRAGRRLHGLGSPTELEKGTRESDNPTQANDER